jgi:hypothetical protein
MNRSFTNTDKIVLCDKYYITPDSDNGVILNFFEPRKKEKVIKENGKQVKTGELEDYIFEDATYHPRICQALKEYVNQSLNSSKTLEEIIEKEDKIFALISEMDKTFKQFK